MSLASGTSQGPIKYLERKERGKEAKVIQLKKDPTKAHLGSFNIFTSVGFDDLHSKTLHEGEGVYKPIGKSTENL